MIICVYAIYDKKTQVYGQPFYAHNDGHCLRIVGDDLDRQDSMMAKHPSDYSLNRIGVYDDQKGTIAPQNVKKIIELDQLVNKNDV